VSLWRREVFPIRPECLVERLLRTLDKGMAPQVLTTPGPGPQKRGNTVDTARVPQPHRWHHDHRDERPHACNDGWITPGQSGVDPETGEEWEE
jgi:hypothetical protein